MPFHRTEWTAREIVASFCVDTQLLRSYGLSENAAELLTAIAQWEIRAFLSGGLRLRTACDLEPAAAVNTKRGEELPELDELTARIRALIPACAHDLGDGRPITVYWNG